MTVSTRQAEKYAEQLVSKYTRSSRDKDLKEDRTSVHKHNVIKLSK